MSTRRRRGSIGLLLQAEVAPRGTSTFEKRYQAATGHAISPGNPDGYQLQPNKWGTELRFYFSDPGFALLLEAEGANVEERRSGYLADSFKYRVSDNARWWRLVEQFGLRLGAN